MIIWKVGADVISENGLTERQDANKLRGRLASVIKIQGQNEGREIQDKVW